MFADRADAGRRLARALEGRLAPGTLVLAIPRGGAVVAAEVAAPVGAPASVAELRQLADEVIVLEEPRDFYAVGQFFRDFDQTTDTEVVHALAGSRGAE